jgi:uncharacterized iron-regulated membrane protein
MNWLHTWGGLLFGWLLFVIFFTGTLTVFDKEITYWMQPELHHLRPAPPNIDAAAQQLADLASESKRWWIKLPDSREPAARIFWQQQGLSGDHRLDPASGHVLKVRDTRGGDFFYRFHYQLHLDRPGIWIVGAAAMVMLVALVTGLVIHHRIFKDFFTFRPDASPHRAWLDIHNVTGVLVLPFHLMITFTGLMIFWAIYMPAGVDVFYGGDAEAANADLEQRIERPQANVFAPLLPLSEFERRARDHRDSGTTEWIEVTHPGDRHATVTVTRLPDDHLALLSDRVTFDGATGDILQVWKAAQPAFLTYSVMMGLHYIWFDKTPIRWLYFLMGLAASTMIATGLVLWTVKRRERRSEQGMALGYRIAESLNVVIVAGLLVAIAAFFWANRLLPVDLADRALWEMRVFFLAWSLCAMQAFLKRDAQPAWKAQLCGSAALFFLLPILNMVTTQTHLMVTLPKGIWKLAAVDLTCLTAGLLLGWGAWRIGRSAPARTQTALEPAIEAEQA